MTSSAVQRSIGRWPAGCLASFFCATIITGCSLSAPSTSPTTGPLVAGAQRAEPIVTGSNKPVKVGLLLPLSSPGQTALIARAMKQAGEMALFEHEGSNVQLIVKDDKGTPEGARLAAEDALRNGAELILGPLFSKSAVAAASVARRAGVPVISFSNDRQIAGNGVYLLSFLPKPEINRIVDHAQSIGKRRFAALIPADAYGKLAEAGLREAINRNGLSLVALETYPTDAIAMLDPLRRMRAMIRTAEDQGAPIEVVFLPGEQENLATLAPLLAQAEIDPQRQLVIGTGGLEYPNAGRDAVLLGARYPAPDPSGWRDFAARYAKIYGNSPPRIASLAYDAVGLASVLAREPDGTRFATPALTRPAGFSGADGVVRLLADGTSQRDLAILEVQKFGASIVEPAPTASAETLPLAPPAAPMLSATRQQTGGILN
jgi:branched-chain amino acid transport system substrate-binding protein